MHPMSDPATHRAHMPSGTQRILNTRSLPQAHRRLATLLRPGHSVLDAGCGTGAITRGIADLVAPAGQVLGTDIHAGLIHEACRTHGDVPRLAFAVGDLSHLPCQARFDVVHAARVLQWLAHPIEALQAMQLATRPGGTVIVLDYNHEKITWHPAPPRSMQRFYEAFLQWRAEAGMDNAVADHLAPWFTTLGLVDIVVTPQHEISHRDDPDFATRLALWAEVAATRGHQMVQDGSITEDLRQAAETDFRAWVRSEAQSQRLYLLAVEGRRARC